MRYDSYHQPDDIYDVRSETVMPLVISLVILNEMTTRNADSCSIAIGRELFTSRGVTAATPLFLHELETGKTRS